MSFITQRYSGSCGLVRKVNARKRFFRIITHEKVEILDVQTKGQRECVEFPLMTFPVNRRNPCHIVSIPEDVSDRLGCSLNALFDLTFNSELIHHRCYICRQIAEYIRIAVEFVVIPAVYDYLCYGNFNKQRKLVQHLSRQLRDSRQVDSCESGPYVCLMAFYDCCRTIVSEDIG